jgi:error-prone DNA polymerase
VRAGFVELVCTTNYTFLTGASHPEELVREAASQGYGAVGIADTHTLAGIVRAHVAAKDAGIRCVVGARVVLAECGGLEVAVYPTCRGSYGRLCRLLTTGKRRSAKGSCVLELADVAAHAAGMLAIVMGLGCAEDGRDGRNSLGALRDIFDNDRLSLGVWREYGANDARTLARRTALAREIGIAVVATNAVAYHTASRRPLHDVLACIREGTTLEQAGALLSPNAERHLKCPAEMARLFADVPGACARSVEIAQRTSGFTLDQLRYEYPDEVCPLGRTPDEHLRVLAYEGAGARYPGVGGVPEGVRAQIEHELALIAELRYAPYFLTVHDIVRFARGRGILCQGRGAAANSAVCYCIGVTSVDPARINVLFERFVSRERDEPPDIDIDFEHERREEVIQYIYGKYGRDRAALTAEVISYRARSAIRDVGKTLGLSLDMVDALAKTLGWWEKGAIPEGRLRELGLDPTDRTLRLLLALCDQIHGFPRHLSQHVGGFVITRGPLCESVPIENAAMVDRTVIEWDKDDIDAMGMLKVDCLGLGMLTCVRMSLELVNGLRERARDAGGDGPLDLATIPAEDPAVYEMIARADTVGVFQIESRAQMSMLPRMKPRCFYDLVIEVAIVRPGPIQGNMVHPYLRRRNGEEEVTYPDDRVRGVLERTLGVPLFQEQAMALSIVAAGFTPGQADELRRAMAAWKRKGDLIYRFGARIIEGMVANGYAREFAERCFEQIKGFSEYGFPESHAASFALIVYASAWLKCHHPAAFAASLLNSQPMGFYAPAQIVRDAREHGVIVRPVDVNASAWDCTLEERDDGGGEPALRLGMRLVRDLGEDEGRAVERERRSRGGFARVEDVWRRCGTRVASLRALARADAFGSLGLDRQRALWAIQSLHDDDLPLFDGVRGGWARGGGEVDACVEARVDGLAEGLATRGAERLPRIGPGREVREDYASTGLSLKAHPMSFLRDALTRGGVTPARHLGDARRCRHGASVRVAGLVLVRQRPGTASGIVFITLEDETGVANLIVRPRIFERYRAAARMAGSLLVRGRVERSGAVVHVLVSGIESLDAAGASAMGVLGVRSRDFR